ncbi:permease [Ammoniphilus sp. CFH 90114]|uniref:permease n=1 Tax=Ammoniphilus sp. CFH 90114 TaxID=2493665 RepID=UPI00100E6362|nr:permease [Ammoniphilus sp. CFH 90114]RXT04132.1 permease [Ammoniphilus sp. CFH 90114]
MLKWLRSFSMELTGAALLAAALYIFLSPQSLDSGSADRALFNIPSSVLSLNTIFLSILIEAIPFVLIGVLIAGIIQIFVTEDHIRKWMPKNKFLAVLMSCVLGALFPACECGIVPIVRRLIHKGVPLYAGIGFLLTGPIINPIVILSTYMAFGNDAKMAGWRMLLGFVVALVIAAIVALVYKGNQMKNEFIPLHTITNQTQKQPMMKKIQHTLHHAIDEFFDMGKYLIIGAFLAALVQTYVSSAAILQLGSSIVTSTLVMMGLAYLLSLCSEADAFIAASFRNLFAPTALLGFLVYGPMLDLKNTFMLMAVFKFRFVLVLMGLITMTVFSSVLISQYWF